MLITERWTRTMRQLWGAAVQVSQAANEAQLTEARTILVEARKRLYRILAEEDESESSAT